jgi:hypothetical protein
MKIVSVPHIKHRQVVQRKHSRKFIAQARHWLQYANRVINDLKYSGRSENYIAQKTRVLEQGLDAIERQIEWIKDHGVPNGNIKQVLDLAAQARERLTSLR